MVIGAFLYDTTYPSDRNCTDLHSMDDCLAQQNPFDTRTTFCEWDEYSQSCDLNQPDLDPFTTVILAVRI